MIVSNIIAVTLFVVTGTTLVTCTALRSTRYSTLSKEIQVKGIGYKHSDDNASDVIFRAHPELHVVRRSLNPMIVSKYMNRRSMQIDKIDKNIMEKLKLSVLFRDNILYIFSYLLHGRESGLTKEQYTSLRMLYDVLRKKMIYMYKLLSVLPKLSSTDKNQQTKMILLSLAKNLPPYLKCTATFLANEIQKRNLDFNTLLESTDCETLNYLANIKTDMIRKGNLKFVGEQMEGHDKYSNITRRALGPVFVNLLHKLQINKLPLSQELFGLILMNLPNPNDDPVLEENIRYIYDVTVNNYIMKWDLLVDDVVGKDAYTLVFSILSNILINPVPEMRLKDAAVYVYNHLKLIDTIYTKQDFKYMYNLVEQNINIGMLLSAIVPQEFSPYTVRMKNRLLTYFMHNNENKDLDNVLKDFNRFAYSDPLDLLMAFLTRILNHMPKNNVHIIHPATALLSALIVKKYVRDFTPFVSPEIDILILLDSLKNPNQDPVLSLTIDSIKHELILKPQISALLNTLIPVEKHKCMTPRQCLVNTFQQIETLHSNIPTSLITKIQNVVYFLKPTVGDTLPIQYQPHQKYSMQYPMISAGIDVYNVGPKNPSVMLIEPDEHLKLPIGLKGNSYVWNIDKYISEMSPAVQDIPLNSQKLKPEVLESMETITAKPLTTVIDKTHTIKHIWQPTTSIPSQIPYGSVQEIVETTMDILKPMQKSPQKQKKPKKPKQEQPQRVTHTIIENIENIPDNTDNIPEEPTLETEEILIGPESGPESQEKDLYQDTSNENESQPKEDNIRKPNRPEMKTKITQKVPSKRPEKVYKKIYKPKEPSKVPKTVQNATPKTIPFMPPESIESYEVTTESITQPVYQPSDSFVKEKPSKRKPSQDSPENPENTNAAVPALPPSVELDQPLAVGLSNIGVPSITTDDDENTTMPKLVLPGVKELLQSPLLDDFLDIDTPIVTQVLKPLSAIFGRNYVKKILKDVDTKDYSTNISVLLAILRKAKSNPEVVKNIGLITLIRKYIKAIEFISSTVLLPVVSSSKRLKSKVVYSTFNPNDLTHSEISENPPDESSPDTVTIPLVNPKTWLQSVNPSNPYADLLPTLEDGDPFELTLQPLKAIFTIKKITKILGPDFQPLMYPNKGSLLITLLHKLQQTKMIQLNDELRSLIEMYINAIEIPSMNTHVSEDSFVKMMSESTGHWQPQLTSLIYALPTAKDNTETAMIEKISLFLDDPNLLEKLNIPKPPTSMIRGELLRQIIRSALSGQIHLKKSLRKAFKYYKDKVQLNGMGALPIVWMWVEVYVVKAEVKLGDMIQSTLNFDKLPHVEKIAYNDLVTYLAENPELLQNNEDFDFEKYETQGQFIKALFKYLLKKQNINNKIRKNIRMLLPRVILTGPGAVAMPTFGEF